MSALNANGRSPLEEEAADRRGRALANRFYLEWIKPTAQESVGTVDRAAPQALQFCACKTPLPKHHERGVYLCATCGQDLRTDQEGKPYRRFPGDLDTPEQLASRNVLEVAAKSKAEMLELVNSLPADKQRRLLALPQRKFEKTARQMIRVHEAVKAHDADRMATIGPNARRRLQRKANELADIVDQMHGSI